MTRAEQKKETRRRITEAAGERFRAHSCGLQTLAPEVARSDVDATSQFEAGLRSIADVIVQGPASPKAPRTVQEALAALGTLIGSVTLARAVADPHLADRIAEAARRALTA